MIIKRFEVSRHVRKMEYCYKMGICVNFKGKNEQEFVKTAKIFGYDIELAYVKKDCAE